MTAIVEALAAQKLTTVYPVNEFGSGSGESYFESEEGSSDKNASKPTTTSEK